MGCCSELIDVRESDVYLLVFYNDFVLCDVAFSPSTAEVKESRAGAPHHFVFVVKLLCCGWIQKAEPAASPSAISLPNTFLFMLITRHFFFFPPSPPHSSSAQRTLSVCLTPGAGTGDTFSASLYTSLVVSLTALVALVVLLVNCVTCCKEREIDFKVRVSRPASDQDARFFFSPRREWQ